ncbi:YybH family protein [Flavisolibacter ginsengisoli]|jgi:ketosteroid isomerase-like protein|uniref:Ketosteroid isomerase homolog n=1 Tax=Flavisolibacter ginsengisoli DSM 18119 TaxID=1121884 RepID=A0A1M4Z4M4_9BACT|nr:nuclear transport factor 2 family protein [Flavisolibacter ginsengisoli]SHF13019.1 Ketosteroid isomerase homolog [Flavisolibacter ginsengisoli DSM 18119]
MKQIFIFMAASAMIVSCTNSKGEEKDKSAEPTKTTATVTSKELNQQFDNAWNSKDSSKLISMLADDVQLLSAATHMNGRTEVTERFIRHNLPVTSNLRTNVVSTGESDALAYESGTFSLDVAPPGAKPFVNNGNYTFVWKKQADQSWKVSSIVMEDLPPVIKNK